MSNESRATDLVQDIWSLRQQRKALESAEKAMVQELESVVDFDSSSKFSTGILEVNRVQGANASISAEKLLERGVSPDIIDYATKRVSYFQYRIKEVQ